MTISLRNEAGGDSRDRRQQADARDHAEVTPSVTGARRRWTRGAPFLLVERGSDTDANPGSLVPLLVLFPSTSHAPPHRRPIRRRSNSGYSPDTH